VEAKLKLKIHLFELAYVVPKRQKLV